MSNEITKTEGESTAIQQRRSLPSDKVAALLKAQWKAVEKIVPRHVTPDRLARVALVSINRTPKLAECSPTSLAEAIMNAATLGLEVNDGTGRAYLVPYKQRAQLVIGYQGLLELAYNSGRVETIASFPVFEGDEFRWTLGLNPNIEHVPCGETAPQKLTHVYAVCRLKGGGVLFEVMTRRQVDAIRARSKTGASDSSPWATDYVEMARKTVLRRVCKSVPKSVELLHATQMDEAAEIEGIEIPRSTVEQIPEEVDALPEPTPREPGAEG